MGAGKRTTRESYSASHLPLHILIPYVKCSCSELHRSLFFSRPRSWGCLRCQLHKMAGGELEPAPEELRIAALCCGGAPGAKQPGLARKLCSNNIYLFFSRLFKDHGSEVLGTQWISGYLIGIIGFANWKLLCLLWSHSKTYFSTRNLKPTSTKGDYPVS